MVVAAGDVEVGAPNKAGGRCEQLEGVVDRVVKRGDHTKRVRESDRIRGADVSRRAPHTGIAVDNVHVGPARGCDAVARDAHERRAQVDHDDCFKERQRQKLGHGLHVCAGAAPQVDPDGAAGGVGGAQAGGEGGQHRAAAVQEPGAEVVVCGGVERGGK